MAVVGKYGQKRFLWLRKMWTKHVEITKEEHVVSRFEIGRVHFALMLCGTILGAQSLYAGHKVMHARKESFEKNRAVIEEKFGETHRKEFGENSKLSVLGYPDMGNNLYAMQLPHKAWLTINNAVRAHENITYRLPSVFTNCFIASLCYPNATLFLVINYIIVQSFYIRHYNNKGYNRAIGHEEAMNLLCISLCFLSGVSSLRILGVTQRLAKYSPVAWYRARKLRKLSKTVK